jgi:hypothetical protein
MRIVRPPLAVLLLVLGAAAVAACGGPTQRPPIEGRGGTAGEAPTDQPEETLRRLAAAARADDGAALDALLHPEHGAWLWTQPGAYIAPTLFIQAGEGTPPSARIGPDDMNDYWRESYWREVAAGIEGGLARLDLEPPDPSSPIYGDCGAEDGGGATRAWLTGADTLGEHHEDVLAEAGVTLDPLMMRRLDHFHGWGLDVWLARDGGRLWVAHVMVWTPCDA